MLLSLKLRGKKKLNESWKENQWRFLLLPTSQVHIQNGVENTGAQKEHFTLMKTIFYLVITSEKGNENASASILNQTLFFRVIFSFFPVSFDGCTADMETQWLLKYSLQRAGVKQSHILLLFHSSGLTFL